MSFSAPETAQTQSPEQTIATELAGNGRQPAALDVGDVLHDLSDAELDQHILDCGRQMLSADALYAAHGCFSDKAARDAHWLAEKAALEVRLVRRTPQTIRLMEQGMGLGGVVA